MMWGAIKDVWSLIANIYNFIIFDAWWMRMVQQEDDSKVEEMKKDVKF